MNAFARRAALLPALFLAGCAGSGIHPVEGQLVWPDGGVAVELEGSLIIFDLPEKMINAQGVVGPDGKFKLGTKTMDDGAMAGDYQVLIIERRKPAGGPDASLLAEGKMHLRYADPSTSDLTATVKSGENKLVLTVERSGKQ